MKPARGPADRDRGAAMVEFALALLPLSVIVFGTIDFGRAFITYNQVKNAAREGAVYARLDPLSQRPNGSSCANPNNVRYRARTESSATERVEFTVAVAPAVSNGCVAPSATQPIKPGDEVTVTVSTPFEYVTPLASSLFGSTTLTASVEVVVDG